jgi:hypothetical protein
VAAGMALACGTDAGGCSPPRFPAKIWLPNFAGLAKEALRTASPSLAPFMRWHATSAASWS